MPTKIFITVLLFISLLTSSLSTSANIVEDLKNGVEQSVTKPINNPTQLQSENLTESQKICEIQKKYAIKHFENRQLERGPVIKDKITSITKIKNLLTNNKQDIARLEPTIISLTELLKQNLELLSTRVKSSNTIDCKNDQNPDIVKENLKSVNFKIDQTNKDIRTQTREFSGEVQMLVIKMTTPKP